jgi:hypothetical protein
MISFPSFFERSYIIGIETIIQGADTEQTDFLAEVKKTLEKDYTNIKIEKSASASATTINIIIGKDSL